MVEWSTLKLPASIRVVKFSSPSTAVGITGAVADAIVTSLEVAGVTTDIADPSALRRKAGFRRFTEMIFLRPLISTLKISFLSNTGNGLSCEGVSSGLTWSWLMKT
ncbi:hypothetical protein HNY73_007927 [Argiope bruennichi]|uniref:Uncharacterized protein n=1 Tax=Argiope bruennichi TaxID=94029 RepID=A0A8T0F5P2_ARGBR|nr:hypothetical protein HNY73_007927 [Argiope bruennichi]